MKGKGCRYCTVRMPKKKKNTFFLLINKVESLSTLKYPPIWAILVLKGCHCHCLTITNARKVASHLLTILACGVPRR